MNKDLLRFLFSFKGRVGRPFYALFQLPMYILLHIEMLFSLVVGKYEHVDARTVILGVVSTAMVWMEFAVISKRLHDFGLRGWWWWLAVPVARLAPHGDGFVFLALVLLAVIPGEVEANRYGPPPESFRIFRARSRIAGFERDFAAGNISAAALNTAKAEALNKAKEPTRLDLFLQRMAAKARFFASSLKFSAKRPYNRK